MDDADLERRLHADLQALPSPRAPRTLLPAVMARVAAQAARPWYRRALHTWPMASRLALATALAAAAGTSFVLAGRALFGTLGTTDLGPFVQNATDTTERVAVAATLARAIWDGLLQPVLPFAFAVVGLMCMACILIGFALDHFAFRRT